MISGEQICNHSWNSSPSHGLMSPKEKLKHCWRIKADRYYSWDRGSGTLTMHSAQSTAVIDSVVLQYALFSAYAFAKCLCHIYQCTLTPLYHKEISGQLVQQCTLFSRTAKFCLQYWGTQKSQSPVNKVNFYFTPWIKYKFRLKYEKIKWTMHWTASYHQKFLAFLLSDSLTCSGTRPSCPPSGSFLGHELPLLSSYSLNLHFRVISLEEHVKDKTDIPVMT